ncbi:MAG: hypothetical protein GF411_13995 [Candidatus Lokiarchaeota archaeon]|nr:hypothetical protein [Candidatus Lokiarchaeota archaeon]
MNDLTKSKIRKVIKDCQSSCDYFINKYCKVKHPSAGIIPFTTFSYQKKCLRAFQEHRFNIFSKTRQCFAEGSMVWTPLGPKPIESIKPHDIIYTLKDGILTTAQVSKVFNNGSAECVQVRTKSGHRSISTPDHKFLTYDGYKEASLLTQNDILVEVNDLPHYNTTDNRSKAILLGYLITDGYCAGSAHFTNTRWKYLLDFQKHYELLFNDRLKIKKHSTSGFGSEAAFRICLRKDGKEWLKKLGIWGLIGENKRVPNEVFSWDNDSIAILINRMFAGDGWYTGSINTNEAGIGSESNILLHQIKQLLSRFGVNSKYCPANKISLPKLRIVGGRSFKRFHDIIDIFGKKPRHKITKGFIFNRKIGQVLSVTPVDGNRQVYDLLVPPNHNYVVDGAVVHNCGASTLSGSFALWFTMFFGNKTTLITSKRDNDAKEFMGKNIRFVWDNLPDWMKSIWQPTVDNEHEFGFSNGSKIKSLPSGPHTLRQFSSSLNIIDEASVSPHMEEMWASGSPTLQHGGRCLSEDSLIVTRDGLVSISKVKDGDDIILDGIHNVESKYVNKDIEDTISITTSDGHYVQATPDHRFKTINNDGDISWKLVSDLSLGDHLILDCEEIQYGSIQELDDNINKLIAIKCGCDNGCISCATSMNMLRNKHIPKSLDENLSLLLGCVWANGFIQDCGRIGISYNSKYGDLSDKIKSIINNIPHMHTWEEQHNGDHSIRFHSKSLTLALELNGIIKASANYIEIPSLILKSPENVRCSFLRGFFELDGSISGDQVSVSSTSLRMLRQIQIMLLNMGMRSIIATYERTNGYAEGLQHELTLKTKNDVIKFRDKIGFLSTYKLNLLNNVNATKRSHNDRFTHQNAIDKFYDASKSLPSTTRQRILQCKRNSSLPRYLAKTMCEHECLKNTSLGILANTNKFTDTIVNLEQSKSYVQDIQVSDINSYVANGFVSHNCLVVATSNGIGNWYWKTWTDAVAGYNNFHPIVIDWWDMDWEIRYKDSISGKMIILSPTRNMRKCRDEKERAKYGPYWSPWLENEYRQLVARGGENLFRQEILRDFLGSGNTVISRDAILHIRETENRDYETVKNVDFVHPVTGDNHRIEFDDNLWVWRKPQPDHVYTVGVDISGGESHDWSAIEVFDVLEQEQVAELQIKTTPTNLVMMVDFIGRWYNNAIVVPERTGIGQTVCQDLEVAHYPRLWRRNMLHNGKDKNSTKKSNHVGFLTTGSGKPIINRALIDNLGPDGYNIYSHRLCQQIETYVHLGAGKTGAEKGTLNDDLPIASGLAFIGADQAVVRGNNILLPLISDVNSITNKYTTQRNNDGPKVIKDHNALQPVGTKQEPDRNTDIQKQVTEFTTNLIKQPNVELPRVKKRNDNGQKLLFGIRK